MGEVNVKQRDLVIDNLNSQIEVNARVFSEKRENVVEGIQRTNKELQKTIRAFQPKSEEWDFGKEEMVDSVEGKPIIGSKRARRVQETPQTKPPSVRRSKII